MDSPRAKLLEQTRLAGHPASPVCLVCPVCLICHGKEAPNPQGLRVVIRPRFIQFASNRLARRRRLAASVSALAVRLRSVTRFPLQTAILLAALMMLFASCESVQLQTTVGQGDSQAAARRVTSIANLARQLNMEVRRQSPHLATLANEDNFLFIYGPPNEGASLNGQRIADYGVTIWQDKVYVTEQLAALLQAKLRPPRPTLSVSTPQAAQQANSAPTYGLVHGTVVLDAGHGGKDPGAPNRHGPSEKHITLDTTLRVREILARHGVTVIMTRDDDSYPSLDQRVELSNSVRPNLFVSIHADSAPNVNAKGYTVYAARAASAQSLSAANHLHQSLERSGVPSRGVNRANFRVVAATASPALLVELGFLSNASEARQLGSAAYRQHLAQAIADGILNALRAGVGA